MKKYLFNEVVYKTLNELMSAIYEVYGNDLRDPTVCKNILDNDVFEL